MTSPDQSPHPSVDERALVARAQRGDVEAFELLYRATSGRVFALCLRMSGEPGRATELLQDVFVRVWEKLDSFRGDAAFATWVHRLAVNAVLEVRRKDARRSARVDSGEEQEPAEPAGADLSLTLETRLDLEHALATLPAGARTVFVLHDIEGFAHSEIARQLGVAEGTVRAQLHRARRLMMEALER